MIKFKFLSFVLSICMILSICSVSAMAEPSLTIGRFDYSNIKISVSADTLDANASEAVIYVYKNGGASLGDSNPPVYMDYVPLADGAFKDKEILLPLALEYGNYKVDVYYGDSSVPLTGEFNYYNSADLLAARKAEILDEAKAASDANCLKAVLFDVDSAGGLKLPVNDEIVSSCADFTDYDEVDDVVEVYNRMIVKGVKSVTSFDKLIELFEECASEQKNAENREPTTEPSSPGKDNTTTGGSKGNVSISAPKGGGSGSGGAVSGTTGSGTSSVAPVFNDMQNHWALKYAEALYQKNIINGYEDGSFKGENNVTRAEIVKMIVTAFNIDGASSVEFNDVAKDSWYADYVSKASGAGIVNGYDGSFNPNNNITRQDAALILYRVLEKNNKAPAGTASFKDDSAIADYALAAIKALGGANILTGDTNGNFNPAASITRAEFAACLCRTLDWAQLN